MKTRLVAIGIVKAQRSSSVASRGDQDGRAVIIISNNGEVDIVKLLYLEAQNGRHIIYCKDMYEPLQNGGEKPAAKSDTEWSILDRKAVAGIRQWVDESVFHHVAQETNAYSMWTKLESMYERKTAQNKASFIRRLVNTQYRDG
ncbi:hypothetical protein ACLB2K_019110 [Fragaria x ananassa]